MAKKYRGKKCRSGCLENIRKFFEEGGGTDI
jgi:hypothetical protein